MNDFVGFKEMAKSISDSINKSADEYQETTGCSDDEKNKLAHTIAFSLAGPLRRGKGPAMPDKEAEE